MSLLPADEAIARFKQNEERVDKFVNEEGSYTSSGGLVVETLPSFIKRIDFKLRGPFAAATLYDLNNVVTFGGLAYVCVVAYLSNATTPDADLTHWALWPGRSAAQYAAQDGASLIGYLLNQAGGIAQDVERKLNQMPSIDDLIPEGTTNHTAYFQQMMTNGGYWRVGPGPYTVDPTAEISGSANTVLYFENTVINHASTDKKLFKWINVDDWGMFGNLTIIGAGKAVGTAVGVYREGGNRFNVQNVKCKGVKGHGFFEAPGVATGGRGDQGNWTNCSSFDCWYGREDTAATGAEYNHWVNFTAGGCKYPNITSAGNNRFTAGNIVDNDAGVWVKGGSNSAHGGFCGTNISHNLEWNIRVSDVDNGETFAGVHCYGDSTSLGIIWIERSKGVLFTGGILAASIACDDATGYSMFANNYCPSGGVAADAVHGGTTPKKVIYINNVAPNGMWALNDPGTCYVRTAKAGVQTLPNNTETTVLYNSTSYNTRDAYNESTGIFTLPWLQNVRINGGIKITGTAITPGSYGSVKLNGYAIGFFPIVNLVGATVAIGNFCFDTGAAATATIEISVIANGTGMQIAAQGSILAISEVS